MIKQLQEELPLMCYDIIFKSVFTGNENILGKMISSITGLDYSLFKDNIILISNELPISKKNEKAKRCDFIVRIAEDNIINLELNRNNYNGLIVKNLSYAFNIYSTISNRGQAYNEKLKVMQINLNCFKDDLDPLMEYYITDKGKKHIYTNNFVLYSLNVYKCSKLYYNYDKKENIPNYIRWGSLIYSRNFTKVPEIMKGILEKEECEIIMDKLEKLQNDEYIMSELEALKWADWVENSIYNDGKEKGIEKGIEQNIIDTIKSMLKKNYSINEIMDITNKSKEEILVIKDNM